MLHLIQKSTVLCRPEFVGIYENKIPRHNERSCFAKLLFQFQTVIEGFTHPFCYLAIAVGVRVKSNGVYQRHINFTVHHYTRIRCDIDNLSDHTAAVFAALVFHEFAFQTQREFIDDRGINRFRFAGGKTAVRKLIRHPVSGFDTKVVHIQQNMIQEQPQRFKKLLWLLNGL